MKDEMTYKMNVEPTIRTILNKVAGDLGAWGISPDQLTRAVWSWVDERIQEYDTPPSWLWMELENKRQTAEASNTIEGETAG